MKVPKARKLPSGSWFVQLRLNGESISITRPTEKQAIAEAMNIKAGLKKAEKKPEKKEIVTLRKAIDNYIAIRDNVLSPSTIRGYRITQKYRFQSIMDCDINSLTQARLQSVCNAEAKMCSAKTLKNAWGLVSSVIEEQTGQRMRIRLPQIIRNERPFLDAEQIEIFVKGMTGRKGEIPALLALCSLRASEIMALRWENIDLQKNVIMVRGAAVQNERNEIIQKETTKNDTSRRDVPIMIPQLLNALCAEQKDGGLVVTISAQTVRREINRVCEENNLPEVSIHGLRHSFASLAYALGMPEKIAMEIGGWANDQTMRKIYTHVSRADTRKYENAMAEFYTGFANKNANKN